ncbi:MAG: sigma-70 family RNA polymerase sigma factor [Oscillospiraceae bacterium]|nr:sigma-70 family RNA polymerase sigma factor [Oscillospiraceae bacterium]
MSLAVDSSREEIIEKNMGLVHACAQRYKGKGIEYDDLFQAGCVGLVKATDAFDPERGVRFSTYAVPVILGEIRRLFRDGGAVKVSRSLKELSLKAKREQDLFVRTQGREPSVNELADILQVDYGLLVEALCAAAPPLSLTHEEDNAEFDLPVDSPEEALADSIALKQVLSLLEPKYRELIVLRYFRGQTQTVVAQALGMTQVQVSRREKKILLMLREKLL